MKKYIDASFYYTIAALAAGVFYREFTKLNGFAGRTTLGFVHGHLIALGTFFFLIAALAWKVFDLKKSKKLDRFFVVYNIGLVTMAATLLTRGVTQVVSIELSKAATASISGVSGIAHIIFAVGLFFFFSGIREQIKE